MKGEKGKDEKFLLLSEEKVAAGGVSTVRNAHTVLPPDDGRGGENTMTVQCGREEIPHSLRSFGMTMVATKNILITFLQ